MVATITSLAKHCTRPFPPFNILSSVAGSYILQKGTARKTSQHLSMRNMSSAKSLDEKIKALEELTACDVRTYSAHLLLCLLNSAHKISDALLKLQKLPPGAQARAGQLADLSTSHTVSPRVQYNQLPSQAPFRHTLAAEQTSQKSLLPQ